MNGKDISDIVVSWVGLIAVAIGVVIGFIEYFDRVKESRVAKTLTFLERSYKPPIRQALESVDEMWFKRTKQVKAIWAQPGKSQKEIDKEWDAYVINTITTNNNENNVRTTIDFYEELAICVKRNICDQGTALDIFGKRVLTFYGQHLPYIEELRDLMYNKRIAFKIANFAKEYKKLGRK